MHCRLPLGNNPFREILDEFSSVAEDFTSTDGVRNCMGQVLCRSSAINGGFYNQWNLAFLKLGFYLTNYNGYSLEHVEGTKIGGSIFDVWGIRHTSTDLLKATNLKNVVGNATETIVKGTRFMKSDGSTDQTYEAYLNQPKNYRVVFTGTQTMTESCPHNATAGGLCEKGAKVEDKVQEAAVGVVLGESTLDLTRFEGVNFTGGDPSREVLAGPEGVVLGPAIGAGAIEVVSEVRDKVVLGDSTHRAVLLNSIGKAVASGANMDLTKSNGVSSGGGDPSRGILAGAEGVVQGPAVRAGANEVVSEDRAEIVLGDAT
ncbi:hypothetical protein V6N11_067878 [Hibiscus sabdariffa]|uniref:Uncharacterized protein n=1 Tax=Hibiscus sabdariffa TaxID=183260 RepID=A0ABR2SS19_9ROSI